MTYILGLTGSIGMGKSTTGDIFREALIAVWDADAAVHELYRTDKETIAKIAKIMPTAVNVKGVDRIILRNILSTKQNLFTELEKIVHPAVKQHCDAFLDKCRSLNLDMAVLDIPLLYETKANKWLDGVLVVSINKDEQHRRVIERGMDEKAFQMILSRQISDFEKRKQADFIIETKSLDYVRKEVDILIKKLTG